MRGAKWSVAMGLSSMALMAVGAPWQRYQDPSGFVLEHPADWTVERGGNGMVTAASPDGRWFAQVIPILNRQQACADLLVASFQVSSRRFPQAQVTGVQRGRDGRSAVADVGFRNGESRAAVLCVETSPRSAMVYTIAAPRAEYPTARPHLIRLLSSFRYGADAPAGSGRGAAPTQNISFVRWSDPQEAAFSVQIPSGWQAEGGTHRYTNLEIGIGLRVLSPDRGTLLLFNDPRLRTAMTPVPGAAIGSPAYGGGVFLPYIAGLPFADRYLREQFLPGMGAQLGQVVSRRERPDLSALSNQAAARYNANPAGPPRSSHGEIVFTATKNGQTLAGYLLCETVFNPSPAGMGHIWKPSVFGYMAPQNEVGQTTQILARILQSAQVNAAWSQSTAAAGRATQQAYHSAAQQVSDQITSSYWARQASQERSAAGFSDHMRDQVRLSDGQGTQYVAPSGKNYYYLDERNDRIIGTDNASPPLIDVRQLELIR